MLDLSNVVPQSVNSGGGLLLTISDPGGIENVVGTAHADTIVGNAQDNRLAGADYVRATLPVPAPYNGSEQWVLLDFDTETNVAAVGEVGEHDYTAAERDLIEANIEREFHGPDSQDPWFHVWVTRNPAEIPATIFASGDYVTLYFNQTPALAGRVASRANWTSAT